MRDFRNLIVWQKAHALSVAIHDATRGFPQRAQHASLISQLTRAADSVAANIVEGCGAATQREFARDLDIAIKSATETEYHLIAAVDRGILGAAPSDDLQSAVIEIRRMLYALRKRATAAAPTSPRPLVARRSIAS